MFPSMPFWILSYRSFTLSEWTVHVQEQKFAIDVSGQQEKKLSSMRSPAEDSSRDSLDPSLSCPWGSFFFFLLTFVRQLSSRNSMTHRCRACAPLKKNVNSSVLTRYLPLWTSQWQKWRRYRAHPRRFFVRLLYPNKTEDADS